MWYIIFWELMTKCFPYDLFFLNDRSAGTGQSTCCPFIKMRENSLLLTLIHTDLVFVNTGGLFILWRDLSAFNSTGVESPKTAVFRWAVCSVCTHVTLIGVWGKRGSLCSLQHKHTAQRPWFLLPMIITKDKI